MPEATWQIGCRCARLIVSVAILFAACGKPFRVPEQIRTLSGDLQGQAVHQGLMVEATAITDQDELFRLFEANFLLARLLVMKVTLSNQSEGSVDLRRMKFDLRDETGQRFEALTPRKALDELYKYYEIGTYLITTRERLESDFQEQSLSIEDMLIPAEVRRGFVFFKFPKQLDPLTPLNDLTLRVRQIRGSASDRNTAIEVQLHR